MARFNEILVGRFARSLQKVFGIKGTVPTPQLASEIIASHNLVTGGEMLYLEGWQRFWQAFSLGAGGAGFNSAVQWRNPVGSNVIAVFEQIVIENNTVGISEVRVTGPAPQTADLTTAIPGAAQRMDARGIQNSSIAFSQQNNAAIGGIGTSNTAVDLFLSQAVPFILIQHEHSEVSLLPGDSIRIVSATANSGISGFWVWRERFLEDSERF